MATGKQSEETRLSVTRDKAWYARWRKLRVLLDGDEIGNLSSGASKSFDIACGDHEICVQMDWVQSEPVAFTCEKGQAIDAWCASPRFAFREMLSTSIWERASRPFTVTVTCRHILAKSPYDDSGPNAQRA